MISKEDKIHYSRNLKTAIVLCLIIIIFSFLFFPKIEIFKNETPHYSEPIITLVDIPSTQQAKGPASIPPKPEIVIPSDIIEIDLPDSIVLITNKGLPADKGERESSGKGDYAFSSLPFIPRQIIEVVPKEIEGAKGIIIISLKIDSNGYVKAHKILKNTSNKNECLENVALAVYKSRWQPIVIEGQKVEYWIEKSYEFN